MQILLEQNKESKAAGPPNIRAFLQIAHLFPVFSVHIIVQKCEHVHIFSAQSWPLRRQDMATCTEDPLWGHTCCRDTEVFLGHFWKHCHFFHMCLPPSQWVSIFALVKALLFLFGGSGGWGSLCHCRWRIVCFCYLWMWSKCNCFITACLDWFSAKLPLNLGSTKLEMFRTFFISSVYLSCRFALTGLLLLHVSIV